MEITNIYYSIKQWTVNRFSKPQAMPLLRNEKIVEVYDTPNLGEDIRVILQQHNFEHTLDETAPYLLACLGAWPGYWLYRGIDWHTHRAHITLPTYIRQTFYQAKLLQFAIILTGLFMIVREQHKSRLVHLTHNTKDMDTNSCSTTYSHSYEQKSR